MAYFSNGSEGMYLEAQCCECLLPGDAPCPVLLAQLNHNYEQFDEEGSPNKVAEILNILVNEKGDCQMMPLLDQFK